MQKAPFDYDLAQVAHPTGKTVLLSILADRFD